MKTTTLWPYLGLREGERLMEDTDGDGLPDAYEREKGLNPDDASDGAAPAAGGYTNLEIFLNGVADGTIVKSDYETVESGIAGRPVADAHTVSRTYYNMSGVKTGVQAAGCVTVVREKLSDGTVSVKKVAGR